MHTPSASVSQRTVTDILAEERLALLDLGLRNPLLNYRLSRSKGLALQHESSEAVFELLVNQAKPLGFLPLSEEAEPGPDDLQAHEQTSAASDAEWPADSAQIAAASLAQRRRLRTPYPEKQLYNRLLKTYRDANTYLAELGVNILYLALGMLHWRDTRESESSHAAPLILVPVTLQRLKNREAFSLKYTEEDLIENFVLAKKMEEFGLSLPLFPEDDELKLPAYYAAVAELCAQRPGWTLAPDSLNLGFFSFGKFMMYRDLDLSTWPENQQPDQHPVLEALLQKGFEKSEPILSEREPIDAHPDSLKLSTVVDADSSQMQALLEIRRGKHIVVQGPPGTGKSQTITNVIADAIGRHQRVLFVSEKMAALEVVKRRLDSLALGDACLELHSHKSNKRDLLKELERTLQLGPLQDTPEHHPQTVAALREQLNAYARAVNTPVAETGVTPYQAFGELLQLREALAPLSHPPHLALPLLKPEAARQQEALITQFEDLWGRIQQAGGPQAHPFAHSQREQLLPSTRDALYQNLQKLAARQAQLEDLAVRLAQCFDTDPPTGEAELQHVLARARRLEALPDLSALNLAALLAPAALSPQLLKRLTALQQGLAALPTPLPPAIWQLPLAQLKAQLFCFQILPAESAVSQAQKQLQQAVKQAEALGTALHTLRTSLQLPGHHPAGGRSELLPLSAWICAAPDREGLPQLLQTVPQTGHQTAWESELPRVLAFVQQAAHQHRAELSCRRNFRPDTWALLPQLPAPALLAAWAEQTPDRAALTQQLQAWQQSLAALQALQQSLQSCTEAFENQLQPGHTPAELEQTLGVLAQLVKLPDLRRMNVTNPAWHSRSRDLQALLQLGQAQEDLLEQWQSLLTPDAWSQEVLSIRQVLAQYAARGFWRYFSGAYRQAWRRFKSLLRGAPPAEAEAQLALLDAILSYQAQAARLEALNGLAEESFAAQWQSTLKDWKQLQQAQQSLQALHQQLAEGTLKPEVLVLLEQQAPAALARWQDALRRDLSDWQKTLTTRLPLPAGQALEQQSWASLQSLLTEAISEGETLLQALQSLAEHWQAETPAPVLLKDWRMQLKLLHTSAAFRAALQDQAEQAHTWLGPDWRGADTDWSAAEDSLSWLQQLHHKVTHQTLPISLLPLLTPDWFKRFRQDDAAARELAEQLTQTLAQLPSWLLQGTPVERLEDLQALSAELRQRLLQCETWQQAWQTLLQTLDPHPSDWQPLKGEALRPLLSKMVDLQAQLQACEAHHPVKTLFGDVWQGMQSPWAELLQGLKAVQKLQQEVATGRWPADMLSLLQRHPAGWPEPALLTALTDTLAAVSQQTAECLKQLEWQPANATEKLTLQAQARRTQQWLSHFELLSDWVQYRHLQRVLSDQGLQDYVTLSKSWPHADRGLLLAWRSHRFLAILDEAFRLRPELAGFDRSQQQHVLAQFRSADLALQQSHRLLLLQQHWQRVNAVAGSLGQMHVLQTEFAKRRRHKPIRRLFEEAGQAILGIKPVVMMSPLSIANYLAPGSVNFDLVIFDEASQVRPTEALGAILRGQQIVVVGDRKQLPPTRFFESLSQDEGEPGEAESSLEDLESVLDLFVARGALESMLRWHYRSRHESLIAVSNREFYDDRLVIFPSPDASRTRLGLFFKHLPEAVYTGAGQNPLEARVIAEAVMTHTRQSPGLSLGVVAFSMAQRDLIQNEVEHLRKQPEFSEAFFTSHPHEPFFVKNLETVQGDERDVILISMGYGRNAKGQLRMHFGPLNQEGGERRLNVLITRARQRCVVFSNLQSQDMDLQKTRARGVQALKTFLAYAETGQLDLADARQLAFDSPFEAAVHQALTQQGYQVASQVGTAGFRVDLAILDPAAPGRYLLGIECDGARYHSARSARDRDRLRQQVLEGLGWRIHRIWSTDWFRHPEQELQRLQEAIAAARQAPATVLAGVQHPAAASTGGSQPQRGVALPVAVKRVKGAAATKAQDPLEVLRAGVPAYTLAECLFDTQGQPLQALALPTLAGWLIEVVQQEAPIHRDEAILRVARAAGVKRLSQNIRAYLEQACQQALRQGTFARQDAFLVIPAQALPAPGFRDRSALPAALRKADRIAATEIQAALHYVLSKSLGISDEDLITHTLLLLGCSRSAAHREIIASHVARVRARSN
ncbi:MAG: DUF3320 domain-containing protein [Candidatus Sericytochromatia bacterium]|nr:DUF3320 domain-containing protein [Candidatus Sericytochromatia bacterium]